MLGVRSVNSRSTAAVRRPESLRPVSGRTGPRGTTCPRRRARCATACPSLAFEAGDAAVGLESPDLGLQRPVQLGWGGLGGRGHDPVGPLRERESLGGFEAPERTAHDIDVGTRHGAGIQRVTKPSDGLGRAGVGEDPLGLTQRGVAGLGQGLLGPGGGVGELGSEGDLATFQPRLQPRDVADSGRERGAVRQHGSTVSTISTRSTISALSMSKSIGEHMFGRQVEGQEEVRTVWRTPAGPATTRSLARPRNRPWAATSVRASRAAASP